MNDVDRHLETTWAALRDLVAMMLNVFGGPAEIMLRRLLSPRTRQEILEFLAPLEALARRLLVIEAARLPIANLPPPRLREAPIGTRCTDGVRVRPSENPAEWRVRFKLWPSLLDADRAHAPKGLAFRRNESDNATVLAHRMEALLRVLRDRGGVLKRMTAALAARRTTVYELFAPYRTRFRVGPCDTLLRETQVFVDRALLNTS